MPTKNQVSTEVKRILAEKANINPDHVKDNGKLTEWPLSLDSTALGFVAIDLRRYAKQQNSNATILASDVRKSGITVSALVTFVYNKIQNS